MTVLVRCLGLLVIVLGLYIVLTASSALGGSLGIVVVFASWLFLTYEGNS